MKQLRLRVILFTCWLIVIFGIEWWLDSDLFFSFTLISISTFMIGILAIPRLARFPLWINMTVAILFFLVVTGVFGGFAGDNAFPKIVLGTVIVGFSATLVYWISNSLYEFESTVSWLTVGINNQVLNSSSTGQVSLYREVRRARNHQRPLTLLALSIEENSIQINRDRLVEEAHHTLLKQVALAGVSKVLCDELEDSSIIVLNNKDQLLVALPEAPVVEIPRLIERLRERITEIVGVDLKIGSASLPQDGFTLEGLVDKASEEMDFHYQEQLFLDLERLTTHNPKV